MPLKTYRCPDCKAEKKSFKIPFCDHSTNKPFIPMEEVLSAPQAKFMEPRDSVAHSRGKSVIKGMNKIVKARARNHSRETQLDELIATNDPKVARAAGWVKSNGRRKNKIDDL